MGEKSCHDADEHNRNLADLYPNNWLLAHDWQAKLYGSKHTPVTPDITIFLQDLITDRVVQFSFSRAGHLMSASKARWQCYCELDLYPTFTASGLRQAHNIYLNNKINHKA